MSSIESRTPGGDFAAMYASLQKLGAGILPVTGVQPDLGHGDDAFVEASWCITSTELGRAITCVVYDPSRAANVAHVVERPDEIVVVRGEVGMPLGADDHRARFDAAVFAFGALIASGGDGVASEVHDSADDRLELRGYSMLPELRMSLDKLILFGRD